MLLTILLLPPRIAWAIAQVLLRTILGLAVGLALIVGILWVVGNACSFDFGGITGFSTPGPTPPPPRATATLEELLAREELFWRNVAIVKLTAEADLLQVGP